MSDNSQTEVKGTSFPHSDVTPSLVSIQSIPKELQSDSLCDLPASQILPFALRENQYLQQHYLNNSTLNKNLPTLSNAIFQENSLKIEQHLLENLTQPIKEQNYLELHNLSSLSSDIQQEESSLHLKQDLPPKEIHLPSLSQNKTPQIFEASQQRQLHREENPCLSIKEEDQRQDTLPKNEQSAQKIFKNQEIAHSQYQNEQEEKAQKKCVSFSQGNIETASCLWYDEQQSNKCYRKLSKNTNTSESHLEPPIISQELFLPKFPPLYESFYPFLMYNNNNNQEEYPHSFYESKLPEQPFVAEDNENNVEKYYIPRFLSKNIMERQSRIKMKIEMECSETFQSLSSLAMIQDYPRYYFPFQKKEIQKMQHSSSRSPIFQNFSTSPIVNDSNQNDCSQVKEKRDVQEQEEIKNHSSIIQNLKEEKSSDKKETCIQKPQEQAQYLFATPIKHMIYQNNEAIFQKLSEHHEKSIQNKLSAIKNASCQEMEEHAKEVEGMKENDSKMIEGCSSYRSNQEEYNAPFSSFPSCVKLPEYFGNFTNFENGQDNTSFEQDGSAVQALIFKLQCQQQQQQQYALQFQHPSYFYPYDFQYCGNQEIFYNFPGYNYNQATFQQNYETEIQDASHINNPNNYEQQEQVQRNAQDRQQQSNLYYMSPINYNHNQPKKEKRNNSSIFTSEIPQIEEGEEEMSKGQSSLSVQDTSYSEHQDSNEGKQEKIIIQKDIKMIQNKINLQSMKKQSCFPVSKHKKAILKTQKDHEILLRPSIGNQNKYQICKKRKNPQEQLKEEIQIKKKRKVTIEPQQKERQSNIYLASHKNILSAPKTRSNSDIKALNVKQNTTFIHFDSVHKTKKKNTKFDREDEVTNFSEDTTRRKASSSSSSQSSSSALLKNKFDTKNLVKNFLNQFLSFVTSPEEEKIVFDLIKSCSTIPLEEYREKLKLFFKHKKFNRALLKDFIHIIHYRKVFCYFLENRAHDWITYGRMKDKPSHLRALSNFIYICNNHDEIKSWRFRYNFV